MADEKTMADVADKTVDKIAGGIEAVAKAVQKVAPHAYEVLVRQARAEGIADLVTAGAIGIALAVVVPWLWRRRPEPGSLIDETLPARAGASAMIAVGVVFGLVMVVSSLRDGLLHVLNPEYYAVMSLIEAAR